MRLLLPLCFAAALSAQDSGGLKASIESHLGRPYVWGSSGQKSFDCSGFVWRVMAENDVWVKRTTSSNDSVVFEADGRYALILESDDDLRCEPPDGSVSGGDAPLNQWVHVACVFDADNALVYVNGDRKDSGGPDLRKNPNGLVGVGGHAAGGSPFVGAMDELRVFKVAKTDAEVAALAARLP